MCAKGQSHIRSFDRPSGDKIDNSFIGPRCESVLDVFDVSTRCLLDTGSQVSTISSDFYNKHLKDLTPLRDVETIINIEVAGGHKLPYDGFIEAPIKLPKTVTGSNEPIDVVFLVVADTNFNSKIPVLLGTNVLKHCLWLLKESSQGKSGSFDLKHCRISKPWRLVYNCLSSQVVNNDFEFAQLYNPDSVTVCAGSNALIDCTTDVDFVFSGSHVLLSSDGVNLPGGLIVTPTVVEGHRDQWQVEVENLSQVDVTIPAKTAIGRLEEVSLVHMSAQTATSSAEHLDVSTLFKLDHLGDLGVNPEQIEAINHLLNSNREAVAIHDFDLGLARGHKHTIELEEGAKPFRMAYRRIPPHMWDEVRDHLQKMLSTGVIEPSASPFASPIVLVRKKDNSLRFCVDYRRLNNLTKKCAYGIPRPQDIFDRLSNAQWFSSLDLKSGYWQLEVDPDSRQYTSFTAGPLGFYQFVKMPFGLCNAGSSFQRMMESCMGAENLSSCLLYLDDIVVFSETIEEHIERLGRVFDRLRECGLKVNPKKCHLFKQKIQYLGHWITSEGISTDNDKVAAVKNWPIPKSREELKRFIGFASFYRRFIHRFAHISEPLHHLLRGQKKKKKGSKGKVAQDAPLPPFTWGDEQQQSFDQLREALTSAPVLAYADFKKPFELHTDAASSAGLGAVLYQKDDNNRLRVIAYASRTLSEAERRYPAHKLEFLALKWAVTEKFADYLRGAYFTVRTDNNPLTYILTSAKLDACGQRWVAELSNYNFDILYKPGKENTDADALSRIPAEDWKQLSPQTVKAVCSSQQVPDLISSIYLSSDSPCLFQQSNSVWWDREEWSKEQSQDKIIQQVNKVISGEATTVDSVEAKLLLRQRNQLLWRDGLLWRDTTVEDEEVSQIVVPTALQKEVLYQLHDKMGHLGVDRTIDLVKSRFYFPKMNTYISDYISSCDRCVRRKSQVQRAPMANLQSSAPMDLLCIDFLSLETSKGGFSNILVMTDHFTRYSQAVATRDQTARTTAKVIVDSFVNHYGMPVRLHSDQGANFESNTIKQLCDILGIKKTHTTPYHPQGNSQCERFNSTLLSMLACLTEDEKTRWKEHLPYVVHAYNCTKNDATGYSPFHLMFGRKPRLPVDIIRGLQEPSGEADYNKYIQGLKEGLTTAYQKASKFSADQQLKNKKYYDKRARATSLEVGDRVLVRRVAFKTGGPHKLADRWDDGVYQVTGVPEGKFGVYDVQLEDNPKSKVRRLHRNLLLPLGHISAVPPRPVPRPRNLQPPKHKDTASHDTSSTEDEEDEFILPRPQTRSRSAARQIESTNSDEQDNDADQRDESDGLERSDGHENNLEDSSEDEMRQAALREQLTAPPVQQAPPQLQPPAPTAPPIQQIQEDQPAQQIPEAPTVVRRSSRVRTRPKWQTSGEYVMDYTQQARLNILSQVLCQLEKLK